MFYEKKFTEEGPAKIYYRDIENMGPETELLGDASYSFRNPVPVEFSYPDPGFCLLYESNQAGNFDIYALPFDEFMTFGNPVQLNVTPGNENSTSYMRDVGFLSWETNGNIMAAFLMKEADTFFIDTVYTIDSGACSDPECCAHRIVYRKWAADSAAVYCSDWNYSEPPWSDPVPIDTLGHNSYCHCTIDNYYFYDESILYEKEGYIFNYYYGELYELVLPDLYGDMHEPHSAVYSIPVDNLPSPLFVTFASEADGNKDIYIYWAESGAPAENLSNDTLVNSNPRLSWGWYAPGPCSRYFLDIWQTEINGYQTLYMSKCALYVCGGTAENTFNGKDVEIYPNPFRKHLTIRYYSDGDNDVSVEVRNSNGQVTDRILFHPEGSGWNEAVYSPTPGIPPGVLYIAMKQGQKQLFRKVIYY